jgi:hypothetical protein
MASVTGPPRRGRPEGRAERTKRPADGGGDALRAELERRLEALRALSRHLSAVSGGERAREAAKVLARIDAQEGEWLSAEPGVLGGRRPPDPAKAARHRERQRALRKLAVLRAGVLYVSRHAR